MKVAASAALGATLAGVRADQRGSSIAKKIDWVAAVRYKVFSPMPRLPSAEDGPAIQRSFRRPHRPAGGKVHRLRHWLLRYSLPGDAGAVPVRSGPAPPPRPAMWRRPEQPANTEARELHQQLLSSHAEKGRQELLQHEPLRSALWLHKAYKELSPGQMVPICWLQRCIPLTPEVRSSGHRRPVSTPSASAPASAFHGAAGWLWDAHTGKQ